MLAASYLILKRKMIWYMTLAGAESESSAISANHCVLLASTIGANCRTTKSSGKSSRARSKLDRLKLQRPHWIHVGHESYRTTPMLAASDDAACRGDRRGSLLNKLQHYKSVRGRRSGWGRARPKWSSKDSIRALDHVITGEMCFVCWRYRESAAPDDCADVSIAQQLNNSSPFKPPT